MRTNPNEPVSPIDKYYGACSVTLRAFYLDQMYVNGEHVPVGSGEAEYNPDKLDAELKRELVSRVPEYSAYDSPYIPPPPDVDTMEGIKNDHVAAARLWLANGKPPIPQLGPTSQGQGG